MNDETTHDQTNDQVVFDGGAWRRKAKPLYNCITADFLESLAWTMTKGRFKHPDVNGVPNWQLGQEEFFEDVYNHAFEHLIRYNSADAGEREEHLSHCVANLMFLMWWEREKEKVMEEETTEKTDVSISSPPVVPPKRSPLAELVSKFFGREVK